jgi:hypothetical protein
MADEELVQQIVRNYYEQTAFLKSIGKEPTITLREYLEGIMLTEPAVYNQADVEYGVAWGTQAKA